MLTAAMAMSMSTRYSPILSHYQLPRMTGLQRPPADPHQHDTDRRDGSGGVPDHRSGLPGRKSRCACAVGIVVPVKPTMHRDRDRHRRSRARNKRYADRSSPGAVHEQQRLHTPSSGAVGGPRRRGSRHGRRARPSRAQTPTRAPRTLASASSAHAQAASSGDRRTRQRPASPPASRSGETAPKARRASTGERLVGSRPVKRVALLVLAALLLGVVSAAAASPTTMRPWRSTSSRRGERRRLVQPQHDRPGTALRRPRPALRQGRRHMIFER